MTFTNMVLGTMFEVDCEIGMRASIRAADAITRLDGYEFVFLTTELESVADLELAILLRFVRVPNDSMTKTKHLLIYHHQ
jgi:hypothetical protein